MSGTIHVSRVLSVERTRWTEWKLMIEYITNLVEAGQLLRAAQLSISLDMWRSEEPRTWEVRIHGVLDERVL